MGVKEVAVLLLVMAVGYWLGTKGTFSSFLPSG